MLDAQSLLVQHVKNQSHSTDDTDSAAAAALRKKERHHHRQTDTNQCADIAHSQPAANHNSECGKQIAEVLQVIEKCVPATQLSPSPRSGPTFLAEIVDHLKNVEVTWHCEVQHANEETGEGECQVGVD